MHDHPPYAFFAPVVCRLLHVACPCPKPTLTRPESMVHGLSFVVCSYIYIIRIVYIYTRYRVFFHRRIPKTERDIYRDIVVKLGSSSFYMSIYRKGRNRRRGSDGEPLTLLL